MDYFCQAELDLSPCSAINHPRSGISRIWVQRCRYASSLSQNMTPSTFPGPKGSHEQPPPPPARNPRTHRSRKHPKRHPPIHLFIPGPRKPLGGQVFREGYPVRPRYEASLNFHGLALQHMDSVGEGGFVQGLHEVPGGLWFQELVFESNKGAEPLISTRP